MTILEALQIAVQHHRAGRLAEAEALYRQILAMQPKHADALHMMGILAHQSGRHVLAVDLVRQAIAVNPLDVRYHIDLGNILGAQGCPAEAIGAYRRALQIDPACINAHYNLGIALQTQGRLDEAIAAYRAALHARPDFAMAHNNLGAALKAKGQIDEAVAAYRRALRIDPNYAEAHNNLGVVLHEMRQFTEGMNACRRALEINPNYADAWHNFGNASRSLGHLDRAISAYRRALELRPACPAVLNELGIALRYGGQFGEAIAAYRHAIQIKPDYADALNNLGDALKDQGHLDEAIIYFKRAMRLEKDAFRIHSNVLATLHYRPEMTLSGLLEAHAEYDRLHTAPFCTAWRPHQNAPEPDRQIRLGFISPHFASHPVGRFLIRPLENLDSTLFYVVCYSDTLVTDVMTNRVRTAAALWRDANDMTDEQLSDQIREDRIDILFDLAGHTARHRLQVFARKPAPIQITWLDYVGTTGLAAMDYILADGREIPTAAEPYYREKVLRMPDDYICYDPPADAPPVQRLPALENGAFTFGSFNIPAKTTSQMIGVWSRILHRVPHARLMLKNRGLDDPGTSSRFLRLFSDHGIGPDRLELRGWSPSREVLACYHQVDVALDTFPYNGGLTTCEAIWMGAPVVTLPGETFASRHGLSHLSAAGLTETISRNLDEYVDLAVGLTGDLDGLAALRAGLRARVATSPLCDGKRFAVHLARILRDVWRLWCGENEPRAGREGIL